MPGRHAFKVGREGDVVVLSCTGLYTLDAHAEGRQLVGEEVAKAPARAVVVDLLRAIHVADDGDRQNMSDASLGAGDPQKLPVAVIVSPAALEAVETQCDAMLSRGHYWMAFSNLDDGLAWAKSRRPQWSPA